MPDVVVIKEVKEDAVPVVLPRLGRGFLGRNRVSCLPTWPWHPCSLQGSPSSQPEEGDHLPALPLAPVFHIQELACYKFLPISALSMLSL